MMREILFRGRCKRGYDYSDGDGWVYGSLLQKGTSVAIVKTEDIDICPKTDDGYSSIDNFGCIPVEENTIGQYTGLTDKNGTKIFEGDILKIAIIKDSEDEIEYKFGSVEFSTRSLEYLIRSKEGLVCGFGVILNGAGFYEFELEVIGNIYDNKSLLE